MRYGIIDIGSNTVRAVICEANGKSVKQLTSEKDFTGIINYIHGGVLSSEGIHAICTVLDRMNSLCRLLECAEIHAFATASLRNLENTSEVLAAIREIGLTVRLLSGQEEAECDYAGLSSAVSDPDGVGLDLGGGSCQIFHFHNRALAHCASLPIGSLAMYNRSVHGVIPTHSEMKEIRRHVREQLSEYPELSALGFDTIYTIGGTARAAAKLHRALIGSDRSVGGYCLSVAQMDELCDLMKSLDMHGIRLMERVAPERITTIVPGIMVIRSACQFVGAQKIQVVKSGVREGYLCRYILRNSL